VTAQLSTNSDGARARVRFDSAPAATSATSQQLLANEIALERNRASLDGDTAPTTTTDIRLQGVGQFNDAQMNRLLKEVAELVVRVSKDAAATGAGANARNGTTCEDVRVMMRLGVGMLRLTTATPDRTRAADAYSAYDALDYDTSDHEDGDKSDGDLDARDERATSSTAVRRRINVDDDDDAGTTVTAVVPDDGSDSEYFSGDESEFGVRAASVLVREKRAPAVVRRRRPPMSAGVATTTSVPRTATTDVVTTSDHVPAAATVEAVATVPRESLYAIAIRLEKEVCVRVVLCCCCGECVCLQLRYMTVISFAQHAIVRTSDVEPLFVYKFRPLASGVSDRQRFAAQVCVCVGVMCVIARTL
jgi:hypothetical protein